MAGEPFKGEWRARRIPFLRRRHESRDVADKEADLDKECCTRVDRPPTATQKAQKAICASSAEGLEFGSNPKNNCRYSQYESVKASHGGRSGGVPCTSDSKTRDSVEMLK